MPHYSGLINTAYKEVHTWSFNKPSVQCLTMSVITQHGYTSLMFAADKGKTEVVSLLLEAGANIDLQNEVAFCDFSAVAIN